MIRLEPRQCVGNPCFGEQETVWFELFRRGTQPKAGGK